MVPFVEMHGVYFMLHRREFNVMNLSFQLLNSLGEWRGWEISDWPTYTSFLRTWLDAYVFCLNNWLWEHTLPFVLLCLWTQIASNVVKRTFPWSLNLCCSLLNQFRSGLAFTYNLWPCLTRPFYLWEPLLNILQSLWALFLFLLNLNRPFKVQCPRHSYNLFLWPSIHRILNLCQRCSNLFCSHDSSIVPLWDCCSFSKSRHSSVKRWGVVFLSLCFELLLAPSDSGVL